MKTVNNILIEILNPEQIVTAMKRLEDLAKQKYYNVQSYYEKNILDEDLPNADDFAELIDNSKWEHFLPLEYKTLKERLNEQKAKAA